MSLLEEGTFLFRPLLMFKTLLCFDLIRTYCFFLGDLLGSAPYLPGCLSFPSTSTLGKWQKREKNQSKPSYSSSIIDFHHSPDDAHLAGNLKGKPSKHDSTVWHTKCFQITTGLAREDFFVCVVKRILLHLQVDKVTCPLLHCARLVCGSRSQMQGSSFSSPSLRYWTPESLTLDEG